MADLQRIEGLFVGLLTPEELEAFQVACNTKQAYRSYEGPAGFLGMAKVRLTHAEPYRDYILGVGRP